jgi:co-chaperonin GroES (HSP10)
MLHARNPSEVLFETVKHVLDDIELFQNQLLLAVYIRPEKTASGLILTAQTRDEDRHQSKVGLILKTGPQAFEDPKKEWFTGEEKFSVGDWVVFRPSDGWQITLNSGGDGTLCRMVLDTQIRMRIATPDDIW